MNENVTDHLFEAQTESNDHEHQNSPCRKKDIFKSSPSIPCKCVVLFKARRRVNQ